MIRAGLSSARTVFYSASGRFCLISAPPALRRATALCRLATCFTTCDLTWHSHSVRLPTASLRNSHCFGMMIEEGCRTISAHVTGQDRARHGGEIDEHQAIQHIAEIRID